MTIGSGVSEGAGVEFPTFPLTWRCRPENTLALLCQRVISRS